MKTLEIAPVSSCVNLVNPVKIPYHIGMNLIDTHAHLTFEELAGQIDDVLARSVAAGVTRWITVGTNKDDNEQVLTLISRQTNLWGALGYHPHDARDVTDAEMERLGITQEQARGFAGSVKSLSILAVK